MAEFKKNQKIKKQNFDSDDDDDNIDNLIRDNDQDEARRMEQELEKEGNIHFQTMQF